MQLRNYSCICLKQHLKLDSILQIQSDSEEFFATYREDGELIHAGTHLLYVIWIALHTRYIFED